MALPPPKWHTLFSKVTPLDTTAARNELPGLLRQVEQSKMRVTLTTYKQPRAAIVPLEDLALLELLDKHPTIKEHLQKKWPK